MAVSRQMTGPLGLATSFAMLAGAPLQAQIVTDGSLGPVVRLDGDDVIVDAQLGERRGDNLFHSFEAFGIETGQLVEFRGPKDLAHVISRVTGSEVSAINGELISSIDTADFWLVNPNGITLGPDAIIDVPAGLHLSTADRLIFEDDAAFDTSLDRASTLSIASPAAFGFLGAGSSSILIDQTYLPLSQGAAFSAIASNILINGGGSVPQPDLDDDSDATDELGVVRVPGGSILVATHGGNGTIALGGETQTFGLNGTVTLTRQGGLRTDGGDGGTIRITTGDLEISGGSDVSAINNSDLEPANGIVVNANSILIENDSFLATEGSGLGAGGSVQVRAGSIRLNDNGQIAASSYGDGRGGNIDVQADEIIIQGRSERASSTIGSTVELGSGQAGDVYVAAQRLEIRDQGNISASNVDIGKAGSVRIVAGTILLDGENANILTGLLNESLYGAQDAGSLDIVADNITLINGAVISTATLADGDAGNITIDTNELVLAASDPEFASLIFSDTENGLGDAGNIDINAGNIRIEADGRISSATYAVGDAGSIAINAETIEIDGGASYGSFTGILSEALQGSSGDAGELSITSDSMTLRTNGFISTSTLGGGNAGNLAVVSRLIEIDGTDGQNITGIISTSETGALGNSGYLSVQASEIDIKAGGVISTSSLEAGNAGALVIETSTLRINDALISSAAEGVDSGDAGRIDVRAAEITLENNGGITTGSDSAGSAGDIILQSEQILLDGDAFIASESTASGDAGFISIDTSSLVLVDNALIETSSLGTGPAGDIRIMAESVQAEDSSIRTEATSAVLADDASGQGGRVEVFAENTVLLRRSRVTSNGLVPAEGASLISIDASSIILDGSDVLSLFGDPTDNNDIGPQTTGFVQTGAASILGDLTLISADSNVAASTEVTVSGLDSEIGNAFQIDSASLTRIEQLFSQSCDLAASSQSSSFSQAPSTIPIPSPIDSLRVTLSDKLSSLEPDKLTDQDPACDPG